MHVEAGVTFSSLLRSILRLDPDVILVGEIRDQETATLAVEAALTGHLVLSTVHANDCVSTLLRMKDLGVPSYLLASAIVGIVAQRMVRKVCSGCPRMVPSPVSEQGLYEEVMGEKQESFIYGAGCNICSGTGYKGRTGIYEIMSMSDELRQKFLNKAPRHELWAQTLADGTIPLIRDSQIKPTFLEIAPSGIPSNIIPHSKGVKCGLIRSNSPFSYSNHRPAKPKIPKPLVYAQVSPLGTSFATP